MLVSCGETLVDLVPEPVPGGGPLNVAIAAARLGVPAALVSRISTDEFGQQIWDHLEANGVDLRACERGPEPTTRAIVEHVPQLRFRFEGEGAADTLLERADLDVLGSGPHLLHGGTLGLFQGRTAEVLADLAERHQGLISLDPNVRPLVTTDRDRWQHFHDRWVRVAHVYRSSDEDAEWIWPGRAIESCAEELLAGAAQVVMVTHGGDGVSVFTSGGHQRVASNPVDVVDTVGAGDTFVAALLCSLWDRDLAGDPEQVGALSEADWQQIVSRATAAAAITCSRPGADPPTSAELAAALAP